VARATLHHGAMVPPRMREDNHVNRMFGMGEYVIIDGVNHRVNNPRARALLRFRAMRANHAT